MRGAGRIPPGEEWMDAAGNFRRLEGPGRNEEKKKRQMLRPPRLLRVVLEKGEG